MCRFFGGRGHICGIWKFLPRPGLDSQPQMQLKPQLHQCWIFNPLHWTGEQLCASAVTRATVVASLTCYATVGNSDTRLISIEHFLSGQCHARLCISYLTQSSHNLVRWILVKFYTLSYAKQLASTNESWRNGPSYNFCR